ncbi:MAG: hemerythrin domain-containing protein [Phycisphaerae bacterium]
MEKVNELANIILNLCGSTNRQSLSKQKRDLLASANCREIAHAQEKVLQAGLDIDELFVMWQQNKRLLPDQVEKLRRELPDNHIIQRILAEHDMIMCFIADLEDINIEIQQLSYASSSSSEIRRFEHIASHLSIASQHPEREDNILFPELKRRGFPGPSEIISLQHNQLSARISELRQLAWLIESIPFDEFKLQLQYLTDYIVPAMRRHIFIENNLVLPLAIELIDDPSAWVRIKNICDEIGYCGFDAR